MTYEKRIRINDRNYYLGIELKYNNNKFLVKKDGSYFDSGDLGVLVESLEKSYKKDSKEYIYDKEVGYMNDVIYLYDRFPFISYINYITFDDKGNITTVSKISKKEIVCYIKKYKIKINRWNGFQSCCPLLYR